MEHFKKCPNRRTPEITPKLVRSYLEFGTESGRDRATIALLRSLEVYGLTYFSPFSITTSIFIVSSPSSIGFLADKRGSLASPPGRL